MTPSLWVPERQGYGAIVLAGVLGPIALVLVIIRLWTRVIIQRNNIGVDDWLLILALFPSIGCVISSCLATIPYNGIGNYSNVPVAEQMLAYKGCKIVSFKRSVQMLMILQLVFMMEICYLLATALVKISVLSFYRRLTGHSIWKTFVCLVWFMVVFVAGYTVVALAVLIAGCQPLEGFWLQVDPTWAASHEHSCGDRSFKVVIGSAISVSQDLMCTLIPFALLWSFTASVWEKAIICGMLSGGFVVCAAGAWRVYLTYQSDFGPTVEVQSYTGYLCYVAALIELLVAIIFSSLPACRLFLRTLLDPKRDLLGRSRYSMPPPSENSLQDSIILPTPNEDLLDLELGRKGMRDSYFEMRDLSRSRLSSDLQSSVESAGSGILYLPKVDHVDHSRNEWSRSAG